MWINRFALCFTALALLTITSSDLHFVTPAYAEEPVPLATVRFDKAVVVGPVVRGARRPFVADPVQLALVQGTWQPPHEGDVVHLTEGAEKKYTQITANTDGTFESDSLVGGSYVYTTMESPTERVCLLSAQGHNLVYVNGTLFPGDPYSYGSWQVPIRLQKGTNHFLFYVSRGSLHAELLPVTAPLTLNAKDITLPDLHEKNTSEEIWAAIPVLNATEKIQTGWTLKAEIAGSVLTTKLPALSPLSVQKVALRLPHPKVLSPGSQNMTLSLLSDKQVVLTSLTVPVRVRRMGETYKQTFVSQIEGSVQYFGVNPAQKPSPENALVLSLHGASVEAIGQADAYSAKDWATLVAPTNRRPFGFDWEDWGRLDALEVLQIAEKTFPHDPTRVVLTGHSMGGHGTWSVGSFFPDKFAAIGPSAGWISFDTYGGSTRPKRSPGETIAPATALLERAANLHDTLAFGTNLLQEKIYVVHGDADDNVPVEQARQMRAQLATWSHPSVAWHEQKGAGHWWDASDAPGADCVDWKPMFDLFQSARLSPENGNQFMFTTVAPSASASCHWVLVEQQKKMMLPSVVHAAYLANAGIANITTENVALLTLLPQEMVDKGVALKRIQIDGQVIPATHGPLSLRQEQGKWCVAKAPSEQEKSPLRSGPFKQAFKNRFILVYPTGGTPEENAWGYARARYDTETFLYRGNGSPEMIADTDYDARSMRDRNLILYGNATINTLWSKVLNGCPIQVERGLVRLGTQERRGDNLVTAFLYPKSGSKTALVGVVGGTGMIGLRLTDRLPYFVSGAAFPDFVVATPDVLVSGGDAKSLSAGYFGNDWKLETGGISQQLIGP